MLDAALFLMSNRLIGRMRVSAKVVSKPVFLRVTVNIADQVNEIAVCVDQKIRLKFFSNKLPDRP